MTIFFVCNLSIVPNFTSQILDINNHVTLDQEKKIYIDDSQSYSSEHMHLKRPEHCIRFGIQQVLIRQRFE